MKLIGKSQIQLHKRSDKFNVCATIVEPKLSRSKCQNLFYISKSRRMLQTIQLKIVFLYLTILAHKVSKRCNEMERKNCSLTLFQYNLYSVKDVYRKGYAHFKIAQKSSVSIQCVLVAMRLSDKIPTLKSSAH